MVTQFDIEQNLANKEAALGALSSFIRSENFEGKKLFVAGFNGLDFIARLMCDDVATASMRLFKKALVLIDDLVVNDDSILKEDPFFVREYCCRSEQVLGQLFKCISHAQFVGNLNDTRMFDVRAQALSILFRLY